MKKTCLLIFCDRVIYFKASNFCKCRRMFSFGQGCFCLFVFLNEDISLILYLRLLWHLGNKTQRQSASDLAFLQFVSWMENKEVQCFYKRNVLKCRAAPSVSSGGLCNKRCYHMNLNAQAVVLWTLSVLWGVYKLPPLLYVSPSWPKCILLSIFGDN